MNDSSMNSWNDDNASKQQKQQKCRTSLTIEIPEQNLNSTTIKPKPDVSYRTRPRYRYHIARALRR